MEKDSPFDDLGFNENTGMDPRIVTEQLGGLRLAASPRDNEGAAAVRVGTGHDNPPLFKHAVYEGCVLVPERLLPSWQAWHPGRTWISKHEEKCWGHISSPVGFS